MAIKISKEKEEYIKNNYLIEGTKTILQKLNISKPCLLKYARKYNLKIKSSKIYEFNENFFENIDDENKAYWLGFIYADGYVRERKSSSELRIKLSIKDLEHLEKFNKTLESNNIIRKKENDRLVILGINSRKIVKDLIDKGCHQAKTFDIKFPYFLDKELIRHFIRGYFDGDGSISTRKAYNRDGSLCEKRFIPNLNFVSGSFDMLLSLREEISKESNIKECSITIYGRFGYINWGSLYDIIKIYHYFYDNSNLYLERKKNKFKKILDYVGDK